jgi:hypothetical protein
LQGFFCINFAQSRTIIFSIRSNLKNITFLPKKCPKFFLLLNTEEQTWAINFSINLCLKMSTTWMWRKIVQSCTIRFCGRSNMKKITIFGHKWSKILYFPDKYWGAESSKDTLHAFCFWTCPQARCK